jgi:invasion protein IalB
MRVLALGLLLALLVGACSTDPNGAPDVTASTALSSSTASSGPAQVEPDHEIVRVRARNPALTKRVPAADTRDRSRIPATNDLREAEVLKQHGEWTIMRSKDAATEEVSCTAVHKKGGRFQLGNDGLYLNFKGNGAAVDSYRLSYDNNPAIGIRLTAPLDQIALKDVGKLKSAKRVKVYVQTVVRDNIEVDLDLKGLREAHTTLNAPDCAS